MFRHKESALTSSDGEGAQNKYLLPALQVSKDSMITQANVQGTPWHHRGGDW